MFQFALIPPINKPTRVRNKTISGIDHIITNSIYESDFRTVIIRPDISDHFLVTYALNLQYVGVPMPGHSFKSSDWSIL